VNVLADTGVWFRFVRRLPLPREIEEALESGEHRRWLSPISSMEIVCKWRAGKLPCPDPNDWLDQALSGFELIPITEPIARQAAAWAWSHKDPADRLIAATAAHHAVELWHTDTLLAGCTGFPQRYFKGLPSVPT